MTDTADVFFDGIRCALQRFEPKAGDVFVLTIPEEISQEQRIRIQSDWKRNIPEFDVKVIVLAGPLVGGIGATIELVHQ